MKLKKWMNTFELSLNQNYKKMGNYQIFVGIDVSKNHLDICIAEGLQTSLETQIENSPEAILDFISSYKAPFNFSEAIFCMEATGQYCNHLMSALLSQNLAICVENPIEIKRSLGLQRGKSDRIDAKRIAEYAYRFKDRIKQYRPDSETLKAIRAFYKLREQLVETRKRLQTSLGEQQEFMDKKHFKVIQKQTQKTITHLDKQIAEVEVKIKKAFDKDEDLKALYEIVSSVVGVGKVSTWAIIIVTGAFTKFKKAEQFACYCGVVPFEHSSGKFKGKEKLSRMANKKLKKLLHMCAMSAIQKEGELREYYQRKVKEGKAKMSVLNAVRNKIIHRIFACVKNKEKYNSKGLEIS